MFPIPLSNIFQIHLNDLSVDDHFYPLQNSTANNTHKKLRTSDLLDYRVAVA